MRTALVAVVAIAMVVSFSAGFLVGAIMERGRRINNQAAIKAVGVGVYQDSELTVPLTEINWGILEPGEEKNHTAYIENESNVPITLVSTTDNWSPVARAELQLFNEIQIKKNRRLGDISTWYGVQIPPRPALHIWRHLN